MSQNELVLKVTEEGRSTSLNENHEAATNLNLVSPIIKTKKSNSKSSGRHVQTHSRESSGTSNLSVKFTIERDETDGSSASITESVSVCSSPQESLHNTKYSERPQCGKPPVPPSNHSKNRRRKCRKSVESSGKDSGIICSENSAGENINNEQHKIQESKCDGYSSTDDLSDVENRLHQYESDKYEGHYEEAHKYNNVPPCDYDQNSEKCLNQSIIEQHTKNNSNGDHPNEKDTNSITNTRLVGTPQYSASSIIKRPSAPGANSIAGNKPIHLSQSNLDTDISTSIYYQTLASVVPISANTTCGNDRGGHRRNVSDSHQPLLYDDRSFDSSSSEDNAGLNSSGYIRRKTKTVRNNAKDTYSELIGCSGDDRNINHHQRSLLNRGHPNIIEIDSQAFIDTKNANIPGEPLKTFVAFVFLFFAWVATTTSLALTHDRVPYKDDPLPDIFLDNVTYQHWGLDASEIIIMISTWSAFLITIFHKHRFIVLRRVFLLVAIHYYYRSVTMFLTVLPVADKNYLKNICMPPSNDTTPAVVAQRVLKLLSGMGLAINGKHVYCGDYIYSGHTMTLIMGYLVIKHYSPRGWFLLHYASMVTSIAGVVTLLLARGHYSIDVVIAYWVTTRIWWIFHTLAHNENLKEVDGCRNNPNNFLKKMWWWHIFRYFECNVPVNLPREYGWPIPQALIKSRPMRYILRKFKNNESRQSSTSRDSIENIE